jgi:hypothetical protein
LARKKANPIYRSMPKIASTARHVISRIQRRISSGLCPREGGGPNYGSM